MDLDKDGNLCTLFHGIDGSRKVETGHWITADIKQGRDGSDSKWYTTGWHVLETLAQAKHYLNNFKNISSKVIVVCETDGDLWKKEHSPAEGLWLAERLWISSIVWINPELVLPKEVFNG
jgi:hypothetical protein